MSVIDAHAYLGESLFDQPQDLETLLRSMEECGIQQAVLAPNRPKNYDLEPANRYIGAVVQQYPERFFGWVRVDPWQGKDALKALQQAHQELGLHGLLLHPWEEHFQVSSRIVDPLVSYAAQQGLPVLIEAGYPLVSHPLDIAELARRHPEATIIASHGLQLDSSAFALTDAEVAMRECPNIIMETSGMYAPDLMEKVARELGPDRLIFGSHSPWLDQRFEVERVRLLNLSPDELDAVMGRNILRLLKRNNTGQ